MKLQSALHIKQTQKLTITPQMQQALQILQMNNLELADKVAREISENPLLERIGRNQYEAAADMTTPGSSEQEQSGVDIEMQNAGTATPAHCDIMPADDKGEKDKDVMAHEQAGQDWEDGRYADGNHVGNGLADDFHAHDYPTHDYPASDYHADADNMDGYDIDAYGADDGPETGFRDLAQSRDWVDPGHIIEQTISPTVSLRDHLRQQILDDNLQPHIRRSCLALIDWLDSAGYLRDSDSELQAALDIDAYELEEALGFLRQLTPAGIAARNLPDCLALQFHARGLWTPAHDVMLSNLQLITQGELSRLARLCDVSARVLDRMIHDLRELDPYPGHGFDSNTMQVRPPEVIIYEDPNHEDGFRAELNEETLPRIVVRRGYFRELAAKKMSRQERKYLRDCFRSGQWLEKALNQRAASLLQVAQEICRKQAGFLRHGVQALSPMVMRDLAETLDLHESTISRIVANKLVEVPHGVFELRYFFTATIGSNTGGAAHSAEAVRARIRQLIAGESPAAEKSPSGADKNISGKPSANSPVAILSDEAIVKILQTEGVDIARRTVAKYREAMGIPSSAVRKRLQRLNRSA